MQKLHTKWSWDDVGQKGKKALRTVKSVGEFIILLQPNLSEIVPTLSMHSMLLAPQIQ